MDLRLWVHLGCTDHEKFHPQVVSFHIDLEFKNLPKAIINDKLEDTVCYLNLVENIKSLIQHKRFNLIEHLTGDVYQAVDKFLSKQKQEVDSIKITTHKIAPPVPDVHGGVSFTYSDIPHNKEE